MDIWYILTSATTLGWRQEHLEEVTEFYYDYLHASLDKLGYSPDKVFPMEAFKRQLDHCYGVGYICGNLLVMVRIMWLCYETWMIVIFVDTLHITSTQPRPTC